MAYDFGTRPGKSRKLVVLKLDHHGDFIIGLPALQKLRDLFQDDHITLICGSWNLQTAQDLRIADEIRSYDYFPENAQAWDGQAVEGINRFKEISKGRFDIAIDLRVDDDTRRFLTQIDASLRCGIGSRTQYEFLDVALPTEHAVREPRPISGDVGLITPAEFESRMTLRTPFFHETDFSISDTHLIFGPYCKLPLGKLQVEFGLHLSLPFLPSKRRLDLVIEVARRSTPDPVVFRRLKFPHKEHDGITRDLARLEFTNMDPVEIYEFRLFAGSRLRGARLRFFGVRVEVLEKAQPRARFLPAELHIGEQLSLLVQLVAERTLPLYAPDLLDRLAADDAAPGTPVQPAAPRIPVLAEIPSSARCIVIAPVSNSTVRDWPLERYVELIGLLMTRLECYFVLVGAKGQVSQLSHICQRHGGDRRLINLAGQTDWAGLAAVLRRADLVIANNSGVAHLAAACGRPTLAIYSGSHQPREWGPRGDTVRALTATVPCSPCGYETLVACPNDHLCMKLVEPQAVLENALDMIENRPDHGSQ